MGGETPKEIRAICPMACSKFEQVNGWMRAGGKKRSIRPMRTWKFSLLASTNAPFDAQTLLNLYAMDPAWAGGPTPEPGRQWQSGQASARPDSQGIYCSGLPTGVARAGRGMAVGAEAAGADGLLAARFWPVPALACSSYSAPRFSMALA